MRKILFIPIFLFIFLFGACGSGSEKPSKKLIAKVCSSKDDCPDGMVCSEGYCFKVILPCNSDDDCKSLKCDKDSGYCVACLKDGDCPAGYICQNNDCLPEKKNCKNDDDCQGAEKPFCSSAGLCEWSCKADADCKVDESCEKHECQKKPNGCKRDEDCKGAEKPFCSSAGLCEWECKADTDCKADESCEKHECKAKSNGCKRDEDCKGAAKPFCSSAGLCEWECKADADCKADEMCEKHECKAKSNGCKRDEDCKGAAKPFCSSAGLCEWECKADADCQANEVCSNHECKAIASGCFSNKDCKDPAKGICDSSSGNCVGCLNNGDCKDPAKGICDTKAKVCVACLSDKDCHGVKCVKNVCLTKCRRDADCPVILPRCERSSGRCVECFLHRDCLNSSKGHYCDLRKHRCIECTTDRHCASAKKQYCSNAGKCEWECRMSKNCPSSKPYCVNHVCAGAPKKIRKLGETCQLKNPLDAGYNDCLPNLKCFNNHCHKPCMSDSDCSQPQLCLLSAHLCFDQCSPSRGKMSSDCSGLYYCQATREKPLAPGYCHPLRPWSYGSKKLGERCRGAVLDDNCEETEKLYCTQYFGWGTCVKACDPRKTKNGSNPDCSATEECIVDIQYSPLGGKCLGKPSRGLGETCNIIDKRCKTNLVCYGSICHQSCRSNTQCKSSEICETSTHACLPKCDPNKGQMSNDCKGLNYCYTRGSNSYCRPLPPRIKGKLPLNFICTGSTLFNKACDGSKDYFCDSFQHRCRQACDPRKNKMDGSNDKCQKNEICKVNITSHLGGECVSKGTQKLGEFCDNFYKRCQRGLSCFRKSCHKYCTSDAQCASGQICNKYYKSCVTKCDLTKGQMSDDCKGLYYCSREYVNKKNIDVCIHLPAAGRGSRQLGDSCFNTSRLRCDSSKKLMCSSSRGVCIRACDPRKTGANSDCSPNEICLVDVRYSFLGGRCVPKGTQKEGEICDDKNKRCVSGLSCYEGHCRKHCSSTVRCSSSQVCLQTSKVCLPKCDRRKGQMTSDCPGHFYCRAISSTAGYCKALPPFQNGPKKLGEKCELYNSRHHCSGSQNLFCLGRLSGICRKACDPRHKGNNSNSNCSSTEVCIENVQFSPLGGECVPQPTQKLGEPCDAFKHCKFGLTCWNKFCYKQCGRNNICSAMGEFCALPYNICLKHCSLSKGVLSKDCPQQYYCASNHYSYWRKNYCQHLPLPLQGSRKVGEPCSNYQRTFFCDGKAGYYCSNKIHVCAKACDPRQNSNGSNSACSLNEECVVDADSSFLGGGCWPKPSQKLGEPCDGMILRCKSGLKCFYGYCYKTCSSSSSCGNGQTCIAPPGACFVQCNPKNGVISNDCKGLNYCHKEKTQSFCLKLPPKELGHNKLGEKCIFRSRNPAFLCDGSKDLFCSANRCHKACDPRQIQHGRNLKCFKNQICRVDINSPLGGKCY